MQDSEINIKVKKSKLVCLKHLINTLDCPVLKKKGLRKFNPVKQLNFTNYPSIITSTSQVKTNFTTVMHTNAL